mmetsp:Transcript_19459/g.39384  ORF Transcript_19459/g.39384 Transcript_19459/m.39384 type:complete len:849 (+) Transcript_19459:323-2869(+)
MHPVGGIVYRNLKADIIRRIVEGRAGVTNLVRVIRAAFAAALLEDSGETKLTLPQDDEKQRKKKKRAAMAAAAAAAASAPDPAPAPAQAGLDFVKPMPPYATCVDELIKKGGLTHMTFARALRILSGPVREPYLSGSLIDVDRDVSNKFGQNTQQLVEPERFPNSFVRGASSLYLRAGVHVESAGGASDVAGNTAGPAVMKGTHLHVFVEPVVPQGGINFGGPITLRVVENEGQCREFVKPLPGDGSRADWGPIFLHAKPVTTQKEQTVASGAIESAPSGPKSPSSGDNAPEGAGAGSGASVFTSGALLHGLGYQALELIRLTNRTPLLWVSIDPHHMFDGRVSVFQPDCCLAEKIFHDGEAISQVESIRALAERPHRIQGATKVKTIFDVDVATLSVRVLGDCLRGSATLQRDLPHTPAVRIQAALAIAQWQNNKAPESTEVVGGESWVGLDLLLQYFKERWISRDTVMPIHYTRTVCKRSKSKNRGAEDDGDELSALGEYIYLDSMTEPAERTSLIEVAEAVQIEEDEEYRVRSAVITAIASIRAKDGMTPPRVISFLENILSSGDGSTSGRVVVPLNEDELIRRKRLRRTIDQDEKGDDDVADSTDGTDEIMDAPFVSANAFADSLLALCHVNVRPARLDDSVAGAPQIRSDTSKHPILPLMALCHRWLEWDLYREDVRLEAEAEAMTGVGGGCYSTVSACAIAALSSLALLRQSTTDASSAQVPPAEEIKHDEGISPSKRKAHHDHHTKSEEAASARYYAEIFDSRPVRADATRAAAAQAVACICCAADRLNDNNSESLGLLTALEFLLDRIQGTSNGDVGFVPPDSQAFILVRSTSLDLTCPF